MPTQKQRFIQFRKDMHKLARHLAAQRPKKEAPKPEVKSEDHQRK